MKYTAALMFSVFCVLAGNAAFADADDKKWIAQCIKDNADAKVTAEVVAKYCTCMNDKMDDNETQSITQWEKSHPKEEAECDRQAGWKK